MKKISMLFLLLANLSVFAQQAIQTDDTYEVFLIDAFVTPEIPHTFVLSFFTTDSMSSTVLLNNKFSFTVSEEFTEDHKVKIDISKLAFDSLFAPFTVKLAGKDGEKYHSQVFELALPKTYEIKIDDAPGFITTCCFGGIVFGLPTPNLMVKNDKSYFSLTKEIPIVTYYSGGYNYPSFYIGMEYTYQFEDKINIARIGLKKIFAPDAIEFISPGVSYYYNFNDHQGASPEISIGWFKISTVFTFFTKYRYNFDFRNSEENFYEISLGLYSSFFSINL